jgi:spermidine dehydrogenase
LSATAKQELKRLFADKDDYLAGMTSAERSVVLESLSWRDYLKSYVGLGEEALKFIQKWSHGVWAIGADAMPAWLARSESYPGFAVEHGDEEDAIDFYFPDGNASVARSLVRKLVPGSAPGDSMEDIVTARFDYSQLDQEENATRIRLNSTVVDLRHRNGELDAAVDVSYVTQDEGSIVTAGKVIWAGYHAMLPHVCPETGWARSGPARRSRSSCSSVG